jgi:hypothetical protein
VPREISLPSKLVDASNCALWDRAYEERQTPSWEDVLGEARIAGLNPVAESDVTPTPLPAGREELAT